MKDIEIKKLLKDLITNNLSDVFRLAKVKLKENSKKLKQVLLIEAQFKHAEDEKRISTISDESYTLKINKIRESLLSLIDDINQDDIVGSFANSQAVKKYEEEKDDFKERLKYFGIKRKLKRKEGKEIYQIEFDKFLSAIETTFLKYCEIGNLELQSKSVDKGKIFKIEMATIKIIPCVDNSKRFLWISLDFNGRKNTETLKSLGVFELYYSEEMELIWRNRENRKLIFKNEELAEITAKEVFEMIIKEE